MLAPAKLASPRFSISFCSLSMLSSKERSAKRVWAAKIMPKALSITGSYRGSLTFPAISALRIPTTLLLDRFPFLIACNTSSSNICCVSSTSESSTVISLPCSIFRESNRGGIRRRKERIMSICFIGFLSVV